MNNPWFRTHDDLTTTHTFSQISHWNTLQTQRKTSYLNRDYFAEGKKKKTTHNPADSNPRQSEYQSDAPTNKPLEFSTASRQRWTAYSLCIPQPSCEHAHHVRAQGQKHHTSLLLNRLSNGIALLKTGMTILYSIAVVKLPWTASTDLKVSAVPLTQLACLTSTGCQPAFQ